MAQRKKLKLVGLETKEIKVLKGLNSPKKIQDFLNNLKFNFEKQGDTLMSAQMVVRKNRAHCLEGAILAAAALWLQGKKPLLLDLRAEAKDKDHVVALFKVNALWGAVSKTNHAVLRYREPVYRTIRELALSYFHEYFLDSGRKTLREYSEPFDLRRYLDNSWITSEKNLWHIAEDLDASKHYLILPPKAIKNLRLADKVEIQAGKIKEFK